MKLNQLAEPTLKINGFDTGLYAGWSISNKARTVPAYYSNYSQGNSAL